MQPLEALVQEDDELATTEFAPVRHGRHREIPSRVTARSRRLRTGLAVLRACRPGQWLKNIVVLVAPAAAGAFTQGGAATDAWVAAISFCLLSSAIALSDQARDRGLSRRRPRVDRGDLPRTRAARIGASLGVAGLLAATVVNPALGALALVYLIGAFTQPMWSRYVPLADIAAPAAGLTVRAVAGDLAAGVSVQEQFLALVCVCSLAVALIRRRAAHGPRATPAGPGGRRQARLRRILALTLGLLLAYVFLAFVVAMNAPSNTPFGTRAVEWLRANGAAWIVADVENIYYSWNAPATGGPALRKLPTVGDAHARAATGYRPPPIRPVIHPALPGEGVWRGTGPLVHGSSPVLVTTFRPDPNYPQMVAGVAWIDSSLTRLALYPGRYEPPNAGNVPADVPVAQRSALLATFNSGFRLEDDQGGFYEAGRLYAPLRDGQATIIGYRDGTVAVNTWRGGPNPGRNVAFARQNLALILNRGRLNPALNNGSLWGATVGNAVRVWRSGVGIDARGNLIYAAADIQTAQSLAQILQRAGAVRAMELDINYYWTTFNFYGNWNAANPEKLLPRMSRPATRYLTPDDRDFFAVYASTPLGTPRSR